MTTNAASLQTSIQIKQLEIENQKLTRQVLVLKNKVQNLENYLASYIRESNKVIWNYEALNRHYLQRVASQQEEISENRATITAQVEKIALYERCLTVQQELITTLLSTLLGSSSSAS